MVDICCNSVIFCFVLLVCASQVFSDGDCWWTGCQPTTWSVTGCDSYGRTEKAREACDNGFKYQCCLSVVSGGSSVNGVQSTTEVASQSVRACGRRVVGYYTTWSGKTMNGQMMEKLTHVIYAFFAMHADGTIDLGLGTPERLQQLMDLAKSYPKVKVMYSVGGPWGAHHYSRVIAAQETRTRFVAALVEQLKTRGFDGVDIHWEYPVTGADKSNFVLLMMELRHALNAASAITGRVHLISFAGAKGQIALETQGWDLPSLFEYVDFVNAVTYNYYGEWRGNTGPPAPLYFAAPSGYSVESTSVNWTIQYYSDKTKLLDKINMGVPFFGRFWNNVSDPVDGADGMWRKSALQENGTDKYREVHWNRIQADYLSNGRFQQFFNDKCKAPYVWNAEERVFLGFENPTSIEFKVKYVTDHKVGGIMIWAVDFDDDELTLLNSVYKVCLSDNPDPISSGTNGFYPRNSKHFFTCISLILLCSFILQFPIISYLCFSS